MTQTEAVAHLLATGEEYLPLLRSFVIDRAPSRIVLPPTHRPDYRNIEFEAPHVGTVVAVFYHTPQLDMPVYED